MPQPHLALVALLSLLMAGCGGPQPPASVEPPPAETPPPPETPPAAEPTLEFSLVPADIILGDSATLSWRAVGADSCLAGGDWQGPRATTGTELLTPADATTLTYTLRCTGAGGAVEQLQQLTISPPPVTLDEAAAELARVQALEAGCCNNSPTAPQAAP